MKSLCPKHRKNCLEALRQLRDICVTAFSGQWSTKTHQDGEPFCPAENFSVF